MSVHSEVQCVRGYYVRLKEVLRIVYSAPVMTMLKLKLVRLPVFESTDSVIVAGVDSPGSITVFCLFQVRVK